LTILSPNYQCTSQIRYPYAIVKDQLTNPFHWIRDAYISMYITRIQRKPAKWS
jgi:hypothetical protein